MKLTKHMAAMALAVFACACSDDDVNSVNVTTRGTVTDDLGNTYDWVRLGNLDWTTSNAQNGTPLSELSYYDGWGWVEAFDDDDIEYLETEYLPVYGNLMTYEEAVASAPDGWRLPTDEDWMALETLLGTKNANSKGFRGSDTAFRLQEVGTGCELGLKIGGVCTMVPVYGWYECELNYVKEYGFYWTSTIDESYEQESAYYRKIAYGYGSVDRECGLTSKYMSVRWCRYAK